MPMQQSFPQKGTRIVSDEEVREEISAIVLPFSVGTLAQASARTKEQAKKIKRGDSAPNAATLINWARHIPAVNTWLTNKIALDNATPEANPQTLIEVLTTLRRMSETDTVEGRALRAAFAQLSEGS